MPSKCDFFRLLPEHKQLRREKAESVVPRGAYRSKGAL